MSGFGPNDAFNRDRLSHTEEADRRGLQASNRLALFSRGRRSNTESVESRGLWASELLREEENRRRRRTLALMTSFPDEVRQNIIGHHGFLVPERGFSQSDSQQTQNMVRDQRGMDASRGWAYQRPRGWYGGNTHDPSFAVSMPANRAHFFGLTSTDPNAHIHRGPDESLHRQPGDPPSRRLAEAQARLGRAHQDGLVGE